MHSFITRSRSTVDAPCNTYGMYFMVEWANGFTGPTPVRGAPHFEGETMVIDGSRYSESQWQTITVMSEGGVRNPV